MVSVSRVSIVVRFGFSGSLATSPDGVSNERFSSLGVDAISHSRGGFSFRSGFFTSGPLAQVSLVVGEKVGSFELGKALGSGKSVFEAGTGRGGSLFFRFFSGPLADTLNASLSVRDTGGVSSNTTTVTVTVVTVEGVSVVRFGFSCKEEQRLGLGYGFGYRE